MCIRDRFCVPDLNRGQAFLPRELADMIHNAFLITKFGGFKGISHLIFENEVDSGIDNRLPFDNISIVFHRNVDVSKYLQIGLPAGNCSGPFSSVGLFFQAADIFSLFKMKGILESVPVNGQDVYKRQRVQGRLWMERLFINRENVW